jgi:hypothetical protein
MKAAIRNRSAGNTLVVVMLLTGIMGVALTSYVLLVRHQNLSVSRSLCWNSCIPIVEAGIEEAMTHINRSGITNLETAGWQLSGGVYTKTRFLGDSYYVVNISQADPPIIISEGHVPVPLSAAPAVAFLAAEGINPTIQYTGRRVRVSTRKDGMWTHAMVAKGQIDLLGNNIMTDSFDSTDPLFSTAGQYDVLKHRDKGDVATNSTITNSLNVADADIWGRASTGPGGSVAIGPNGSVGDLDWHNTFKRGIEPGWTRNDMNVYFRSVTRPYNSGYTPVSGVVGGTNFTYVLSGTGIGSSGNYMMSDLSLQGQDIMLVTGHCRLLVTQTLNIQGNAQIEIAPGASLELYMEGADASLGGNGIVNDAGYAINFIYFGLPSNQTLSFSGNGTFLGAIYAPDTAFTLGGGGSNNQDFIGASVSSTVKMNGKFHFHYDESLGRAAFARGYLVNSWNEI